MIDPAEVERHRLSPEENERIFRERIVAARCGLW